MKNLMRYTTIFLIVLLAACGGGDGAPPADEAPEAAVESAPAAAEAGPAMDLPEGVTAAMVAEGETIFSSSTGICFTCHMQGGVGGPLAPNLTDSEWINTDGTFDGIVQTVTTGVPEPQQHPGIMLPKGGTAITDEDVRAVAAYVWSLSQGG